MLHPATGRTGPAPPSPCTRSRRSAPPDRGRALHPGKSQRTPLRRVRFSASTPYRHPPRRAAPDRGWALPRQRSALYGDATTRPFAAPTVEERPPGGRSGAARRRQGALFRARRPLPTSPKRFRRGVGHPATSPPAPLRAAPDRGRAPPTPTISALWQRNPTAVPRAAAGGAPAQGAVGRCRGRQGAASGQEQPCPLRRAGFSPPPLAIRHAGQRPTAGGRNGDGQRFMATQPPRPFVALTLQERPPGGAVGRCPAAPQGALSRAGVFSGRSSRAPASVGCVLARTATLRPGS